MTFSLLARDPRTGEIGGATATGLPAVGGFVLHLRAGAGGIATQGYSTNTLYGPRGLRLLEDGETAEAVCRLLTDNDPGRGARQLIAIDEAGRTAGWTGQANIDRKLHICAPDLAVAGNWISSEATVFRMREAYRAATARPMAERLIAALAAGEAAGSDSRGLQSAALAVVGRDRPPLELRADLSDQPIAELARLLEAVGSAEFKTFYERLPTLASPARG